MDYDPCCGYPCENGGICVSEYIGAYSCDCTRTGYHGINCSNRKFLYWFELNQYFQLDASEPKWVNPICI